MLQLREKTALESLRFRGIHYCIECPLIVKHVRFPFDPAQPACQCPYCGTTDLGSLSKRDAFDAMYLEFFGVIYHWLTGAQLYHCVFCRIQFYDARPLWPALASPAYSHSALPGRSRREPLSFVVVPSFVCS